MPDTPITIIIDDAEIQAALERLQAAGTDLVPVLEEIGNYLVSSTKERFPTQTAPDGTPWRPWAKSTLKQRQKSGLASQMILQRSMELRDNIRAEVGADFVEVGSPTVYARIHQFGGDIVRYAYGRQIFHRLALHTHPDHTLQVHEFSKWRFFNQFEFNTTQGLDAAGEKRLRHLAVFASTDPKKEAAFRKSLGAKGKLIQYQARNAEVPEHTITIPARPYLGVSATDQTAILDIVKKHMQGAITED